MAIRVVAVHGIGQYRSVPAHIAAAELTNQLRLAVTDGLQKHQPAHGPVDLRAVYYAHHLRGSDQGGDVELGPAEQRFLMAWAAAYGVPTDNLQAMTFVPIYMLADWIAQRVSASSDDSLRRRLSSLLSNLARDSCRYLHHPQRRAAARAEVATALTQQQPHVVVAHSLGSVVAYETLWANESLKVEHLITVGSPLAMPGAIFDHLAPAPVPDVQRGRGRKPPNVAHWTNISDASDVVAIPRPLHCRFDGLRPEADVTTSIGALAIHSFGSYLSNRETARAIVRVG